MSTQSTLKFIGIVDGTLTAGLVAVAAGVPAWSGPLHVAAIVLGAAGTVLATVAAALPPDPAPPAPPAP